MVIIGREDRTPALASVGHSWQSPLAGQLNALNACALQPLPSPHVLWHAFGPGEQRLWQRRFSFGGSVPNADSPILGTSLPTVTESKLLLFQNAYVPIYSTESGMLTEVRPLAPNALVSIRITLLGMTIDVRLVHPLQKCFGIVDTLLDMVMLVRSVHSKKA